MCILLTFLAMFTPKYEDLYKLLEYTETIHAVYLSVTTYPPDLSCGSLSK
jgi:hypothetical protein